MRRTARKSSRTIGYTTRQRNIAIKGLDVYIDTSGKLARDSDSTVATINLYAKLRLLDFIIASNGVKLFRSGQSERVRKIKQQRLKARGRRT